MVHSLAGVAATVGVAVGARDKVGVAVGAARHPGGVETNATRMRSSSAAVTVPSSSTSAAVQTSGIERGVHRRSELGRRRDAVAVAVARTGALRGAGRGDEQKCGSGCPGAHVGGYERATPVGKVGRMCAPSLHKRPGEGAAPSAPYWATIDARHGSIRSQGADGAARIPGLPLTTRQSGLSVSINWRSCRRFRSGRGVAATRRLSRSDKKGGLDGCNSLVAWARTSGGARDGMAAARRRRSASATATATAASSSTS